MKIKLIILLIISLCFCSCLKGNEAEVETVYSDNYFFANDTYLDNETNIELNEIYVDTEKYIYETTNEEQIYSSFHYDEANKKLNVYLIDTNIPLELPKDIESATFVEIENLTNNYFDASFLSHLQNVQQISINGTICDLSFAANYINLNNVYIEHFNGRLSGLCENPSIKKIVISNSQIEIENINKWNKIEEIYISDSNVNILGCYSGLNNLKIFNSICSCFENNDLSFVNNLTELTEFTYSPLQNIDLNNYLMLSSCTGLKELSLSGNITNLCFLTKLKKIDKLSIITENYFDLSPLFDCDSLSSVFISCTGYDSEKKATLINKYPQCSWNIESCDKIFS